MLGVELIEWKSLSLKKRIAISTHTHTHDCCYFRRFAVVAQCLSRRKVYYNFIVCLRLCVWILHFGTASVRVWTNTLQRCNATLPVKEYFTNLFSLPPPLNRCYDTRNPMKCWNCCYCCYCQLIFSSFYVCVCAFSIPFPSNWGSFVWCCNTLYSFFTYQLLAC